jgi:ubiquinol-cytochrome c reductase iron-sulfur subunit
MSIGSENTQSQPGEVSDTFEQEHEVSAKTYTPQETRRDFILTWAAGFATVGAACAIWPLLDSMNPGADVLASGAPANIDLSNLSAGSQRVVKWRGLPLFVARRTPEELKVLQEPRDTRLLRDPDSNALQQPSYAKNWHRSIKPEYLVLIGICTHLGCIPEFKPKPGELAKDWLGGYFCPCHGSKYDLSGRVYEGVPAPYNLPVPPHRFVQDNVIRVGENPKGSKFELESIEQL